MTIMLTTVMAIRAKQNAYMAWSSGKDAAWALHEARKDSGLNIVGLLTTVTQAFDRVSMHGVRRALLEEQAASVGLPLHVVEIPAPCSNEIYETLMSKAMERARAEQVDTIVFGDIFLAGIRAYRERQLSRAGMTARFPLWNKNPKTLAREMLRGGLEATVTCVDTKVLSADFAGRPYDESFLDLLPTGVDPCGENGEFHTLVTRGPMMKTPLDTVVKQIVSRDGFLFADVLLKSQKTIACRTNGFDLD